MIPHNYILIGQTPVEEPDLLKWARWFGDADRKVAETEIDGHFVSTVFLGVDHQFGGGPPLLFETMIFTRSGEVEDYQRRCSTWLEAEEQHQTTVAIVQAQMK